MSTEKAYIVLIDDDPDMHHAVRAILEPQGYRVACFATAAAGLTEMRVQKPDLLLLDIMLTEPSEGFHVAYSLRRDDELKDVPIVMISAIGQRMGFDYAKDAGTEWAPAEAFLEKPVSAAALRDTVARLLGVRS